MSYQKYVLCRFQLTRNLDDSPCECLIIQFLGGQSVVRSEHYHTIPAGLFDRFRAVAGTPAPLDDPRDLVHSTGDHRVDLSDDEYAMLRDRLKPGVFRVTMGGTGHATPGF